MKNKKLYYIAIVLVIVIVGGIFFMNDSSITFVDKKPVIEINTNFDAYANISSVKDGTADEVVIDTSALNTEVLGEYPVIYTYKDEVKKLMVKVVDRVAPEFETVETTICENEIIDASLFVKDIKDATNTKVYLKDNYTFTAGEQKEVIVVVEDEGGNKTEKPVLLNVDEPDYEAPVVNDEGHFQVMAGKEVNLMDNLFVSDNWDKAVSVTADLSNIDTSKEASYEVNYIAKDRAGNQSEFTRTLKVLPAYPESIEKNEEKVVYLTFDDGPSANTGEVIDILKSYGVTATFFVTGNRPEYNHFIKEAYDAGNTIGLHSFSHDYELIYSSVDAYFKDLNELGKMVEEITGEYPRYIRFPGGSSNMISANYTDGIMSTLTKEVIRRGFQYYDWNIGGIDASGNNVPAKLIYEDAIAYIENNRNILFHDTDAKDTTIEALPEIIEYFLEEGYTIKAIDDTSFTPHHQVNN